QHLVVARELCCLDVAAIHGPEAVIWCAPKLLTVGEAHTKDRRDTILHYDQRRARNDAFTGLFRGRAMRVDLNLFAFRGEAPELTESKQTASRMNARIPREARVRRVDAARVRERVPVVDRCVVLDTGVGALPGRLGHVLQDLARLDRVDDGAVGACRQVAVAVGL